MSRIVTCSLLILGLAGVGFGSVLTPENLLAAGLTFCVGIPAIISAYVLDKRRREQKEATRQAEISRRIAELIQRPWTSRQSLQITGNTSGELIANILLMGLPVLLIYGAYPDIFSWTILACTLFFIFLLICATRNIALLGKPVCELSKNGIKTPIYGEIDWKDIEGIFLETRMGEGKTTSHFLKIRTSNNPAILKNIHWADRFMSLIGLSAISLEKTGIPITSISEHPEVISEVAIYLWRQATGATHHWNPYFSDKLNEAEKRISDFMQKHPRDEENGEITESELLTLEAELKQIHIDMETMHSETEKSHQQIQKTLKWLPIIPVCILVYLIVVFVTDYLI